MQNTKKILFLGNSITRHLPAPEIGWHGDWGMAASAKEKDYAHILTRKYRELHPDITFMAINIAQFERGFWSYDLDKLSEAKAFSANLTIVRIGENVDEKEADTRNFSPYYRKLLEYAVPAGEAALCVGSFWGKPIVNGQMEAVAADCGYPYLDISHLGNEEANKATGLFEHEGVASHPSDHGMEAIAQEIWALLGGDTQ